MISMRRDRKSSIKKERIVMIASSAFVLAALTMTGVYMKALFDKPFLHLQPCFL